MSGPSHGVRIVMMAGLGPGPFCGMLLGDLGEDMIRIDQVGHVDEPMPAPRFSRTPPQVPTVPALAGDHTAVVLAELGIDHDEIADLLGDGLARPSAATPDDGRY